MNIRFILNFLSLTIILLLITWKKKYTGIEEYREQQELKKDLGRFRVRCYYFYVKRNKLIVNYEYVEWHYYFMAFYIIIIIILNKMHIIDNAFYFQCFWILNIVIHTMYYIITLISYFIFYYKVEKRIKKNSKEKKNAKT